jgi:formate/nitrite transporter FocA (FNT family)
MFTVPLYFQISANASAMAAGAHLFPAVAGNAVGGLVVGALIKRYTSVRTLYCHFYGLVF